ncbi:hypothetical protein [Dorea longicatena]|uniref:hypothetical protein n=1 Tax=Dorea longicatena TaxID=88431 RepID=UPI0022E941B4|nr:hypothetical protein [Dorea longicatena]
MKIGITADFIKKIRNYIQSNSEENKLYVYTEVKKHEVDCFGGELYENSDIYTLTVSEEQGIYFKKDDFNRLLMRNWEEKQEKYAESKGADIEDEELNYSEFIPAAEIEDMYFTAEYEAYESAAMTILKDIIESHEQKHEKIMVFTKENDLLLQWPVEEKANGDTWEVEQKNIKRIKTLLEARLNIPIGHAIAVYVDIKPEQIGNNHTLKAMYQLGKMSILQDKIEARRISSFSKKDGKRYLLFDNACVAGISWDYGTTEITEFQTMEDVPEWLEV